MRVAFGIGALGCWFGARLSPHRDVTLIGVGPETGANPAAQRRCVVVGCHGEKSGSRCT